MVNETRTGLAATLPELRAEYERLGNLIQALEAYAGEADPGADPGSGEAPRLPARGLATGRVVAITSDQFVGMSASTAIRTYLELMGKGNPKGPRDMARAFVQGGRENSETRAYSNVTSALKRMNKAGEVKQVRRGQWGLASWYSNSAPRRPSPQPSGGIASDDLL